MIVSNRKYPFGSRVSVIKTPGYNLMISTAPEGIFKSYSICISYFQGEPSDGRVPVAKALLHPTLPKSGRLDVHQLCVECLNEAGSSGLNGPQAVEAVFARLKAHGPVVDYINPLFDEVRLEEEEAAGAPTRACFPVGRYRLDAPVAGLDGLIEFSPDEYEAMGGRVLAGETNYNARLVEFGDRRWKVTLQTVNGRISKIAAYTLLSNKRDPLAMETLNYCKEVLGNPTEHQTGLFIWDTMDGNVVLQTGDFADGLGIGLFLTSRSVRNFTKK